MSNHGGTGTFLYVLPPAAGALVFAFLALIAILRGKRNATTCYFAALCVLGAAINCDIALVGTLRNRELALQIDRFVYLFFVFAIPLYIKFVHAFLGITERKWIEYLAWAASAIVLQFVPTEYFIRRLQDHDLWRIAEAGPVHAVFSILGGLTILYCLLALMRAMRRAPDNVTRNRIRYVTVGIGLSSLFLLIDTIAIAGFRLYPIGNFNFMPAVILAFGVLKYNLLDMHVLLRKGTALLILAVLLTLCALALLSIASLLSVSAGTDYFFAEAVIVVVLIVTIADPLRRLVDGYLQKQTYDRRQVIDEIETGIAGLHHADGVARCAADAVRRALDVTHASIILCDAAGEPTACCRAGTDAHGEKQIGIEGWDTIAVFLRDRRRAVGAAEAVQGNRPARLRENLSKLYRMLGAALLVPLVTRQGMLAGLLALGEKKTGELFVREDIMLLGEAAQSCANGIARARSFEWLEAVAHELEAKVQARTGELRRALQEKEETQAQLVRSESLASIGQLVAGVAHELNNPLAAASSLIESGLESLRECGRNDHAVMEVEGDLSFSLGEIARAAAIVKSLLGLSRQTQVLIEAVDMNMVIDDAVRMLHSNAARRRVKFVKDYDPALSCIEGNYAHLGQVMMNIIRNAMDAIDGRGGGVVTLTSSRAADNECIAVACRDTGCGIPAEIMSDIFKPFFTTKRPGEGTGLGLYIAHEIVMRHGGTITAETAPGGGAEITILLPVTRGGHERTIDCRR